MRHAKCVMRYNDISIKIPDSFNADVQGFGIEFTGHGIDYYLEVMRKLYPDYTVCNLLAAFFHFPMAAASPIMCPAVILQSMIFPMRKRDITALIWAGSSAL